MSQPVLRTDADGSFRAANEVHRDLVSSGWDAAALLACAAMFWLGLGSPGLIEGSDARYAEIAREMWASGDWVVPSFLGIPHFHKPPLVYWLTSASYAVFGPSEWAARACQGVLGLALAVRVFCFCRRHLGRDCARWAVLFLAATPAMVGATRGLTTDLLLATCLTLVLTSGYDVWSGREGRFSLPALYGGIGLTLLAKGPVGILVLAAVWIPFAWLQRGQSPRTRCWRLGAGALLVTALALPWYALVVLRTPGLLDYFVWDQLAARVVGGGLGHEHPWYYFIGLFPVLGLPWILLLPAGLRRVRRGGSPLGLFLALWVLAPPVVFSFSATKLPLYVLPSYPAVAVLAAAAVSAGAVRVRAVRSFGALFLLLSTALAVLAAGVLPVELGRDLSGLRPETAPGLLLPMALVFLLAGLFARVRSDAGPGRLRSAVLALALATGILPGMAFSHGDALPIRSVRRVGLAAAAELREGDVLVEYRSLTGGLPFYTGRIPLLAKMTRDTRFGGGERMLSEDAFLELWGGPRRVLAVTGLSHVDELSGGRVLAHANGYALVGSR